LGTFESLSGTITGENIFKALLNTFENDQFLKFCYSVTTGGAKSMIGEEILSVKWYFVYY